MDALDQERRWPGFTPRALRTGRRSTPSAPGSVDGVVWGALNVYSSQASAFAASRDAEVLRRLAHHLSRLATWHQRSGVDGAGRGAVMTVRTALERRDSTARATGMLMERHGLGAEAAFRELSRLSEVRQVPLHVVAEAIERGETTPASRNGP